jgi:hypothetical protein
MGGACTLDFLGAPNEFSIIAVPRAPDGYPIKTSILITKPGGSEIYFVGEDPNNPNELGICTPLCEEPACCTLGGSSSSGGFDYLFDEFGTYIITAIVFAIDNSILAQDSITLNNPEPVVE